MMRLFWSSRSPFARKVMVAAHELGLAHLIVPERVIVSVGAPNDSVMAHNPLNKIPTLILDSGEALYDSRVICEYLDAMPPGSTLFPADEPERWSTLCRQALGDGLMEVLGLRLGERSRRPGIQSDALLAARHLKIGSTLDAMERPCRAWPVSPICIGDISIACALSHLDFRFPDHGWRTSRPALAAWHTSIAGRPSMLATEYQDVY